MNLIILDGRFHKKNAQVDSYLACRGEQNPPKVDFPLSLQPGSLHVGCWAFAHVRPQYGWTVPSFSMNFGRFPQVCR